MRIVISSPPRSGNHWLKCLLSQIYELEWLGPKDQAGHRPDAVRAWAERGGFRDNSIYFQHCRFPPDLCDALESVPAHLVTIIRDPYDMFVSYYHWIQERAAREHGRQQEHKRDVFAGKAIDDPEVLAYLADRWGSNLRRANGWLHSGRAIVVRYEGLHDDPVAELERHRPDSAGCGRSHRDRDRGLSRREYASDESKVRLASAHRHGRRFPRASGRRDSRRLSRAPCRRDSLPRLRRPLTHRTRRSSRGRPVPVLP